MKIKENQVVFITFFKNSNPNNPKIEEIKSKFDVLAFPITSDIYDAIIISFNKVFLDSEPYLLIKGEVSREYFDKKTNFAFLYIEAEPCEDFINYLLYILHDEVKSGNIAVFKGKLSCKIILLVAYILNREIDNIWRKIYLNNRNFIINRAVTYIVLSTDFI